MLHRHRSHLLRGTRGPGSGASRGQRRAPGHQGQVGADSLGNRRVGGSGEQLMPFLPLPKLRGQMVAVSHRLHHNGWVANHDGNASVRVTGHRYLITCSSVSKRDVDDASLLLVDGEGKVLEGRRKPFSELDLHLVLYRSRPDVDAVLHAHPPYATAWGLPGKDLAQIPIPEIIVSLGDRIPTLPRTLPRDPSATATLRAEARCCYAILPPGTGV